MTRLVAAVVSILVVMVTAEACSRSSLSRDEAAKILSEEFKKWPSESRFVNNPRGCIEAGFMVEIERDRSGVIWVGPTEKGAGFLPPRGEAVTLRTNGLSTVLREVTGISEPVGGDASIRVVTFKASLDIPPGAEVCISETVSESSATLQKFDTGWRVVRMDRR